LVEPLRDQLVSQAADVATLRTRRVDPFLLCLRCLTCRRRCFESRDSTKQILQLSFSFLPKLHWERLLVDISIKLLTKDHIDGANVSHFGRFLLFWGTPVQLQSGA